MNHFSIIVLKTQLEQQEKLLEQYRKEKSKLNWEGKARVERNIEQLKENISDLKTSIQIIDEALNPVVGKSKTYFSCSEYISFSDKNNKKIFQLTFKSFDNIQEFVIQLNEKEAFENQDIAKDIFTFEDMVHLSNLFNKQNFKKLQKC